MSKEEIFKNKKIKNKVYETITLIIVMYMASVIFASIMLMVMRVLPIEMEMAFGIVTIAVLLIVAAFCVRTTLVRGKWLVKYIAEPIAELSEVAGHISVGKLDDVIAYESEDEIGALAGDFRKTVSTLHKIIEDLSNILEEFAKGNYTVHSGCKEAYVGDFQAVMDKLVATVTNVSATLNMIRQSSDEVASGAGQLAVSAQDLARVRRNSP